MIENVVQDREYFDIWFKNFVFFSTLKSKIVIICISIFLFKLSTFLQNNIICVIFGSK